MRVRAIRRVGGNPRKLSPGGGRASPSSRMPFPDHPVARRRDAPPWLGSSLMRWALRPLGIQRLALGQGEALPCCGRLLPLNRRLKPCSSRNLRGLWRVPFRDERTATMSRSGILPALLVLTLSLCISSNAEARKRAWYYSNGFSAPFRDGDSQHTRAEGRRARIEGRGDQTEKRGNRAEERFGSTRARAADAICRHAIRWQKSHGC
jgi:hypothetical protein